MHQGGLRSRRRSRGQVDLEAGPAAGFGIDLQPGPMPAEDALDGREPQTVPRGFRGEEGIEDPGQDFRRHADTGVPHLQHRVEPRHQALTGEGGRDEGLVQGPGAGGDADLPFPIPQGIAGVGDEVEETFTRSVTSRTTRFRSWGRTTNRPLPE